MSIQTARQGQLTFTGNDGSQYSFTGNFTFTPTPRTRKQRFLDTAGKIANARTKHAAVAELDYLVRDVVHYAAPFTIVEMYADIEREHFQVTEVAKCCATDTFDEGLGYKIARGRALLRMAKLVTERYDAVSIGY